MYAFLKTKSRAVFLALLFAVVFPGGLFADDLSFRNSSISFDPITFLGLWLLSNESDNVGFRNLWFAMDVNMATASQREIGLGIILTGSRIALITRYRSFYNRERQSGFFWGLYGLLEWRRMSWYYDENSETVIHWSFLFEDRGNTYHSIGITAGVDIGFRIRINNFGITPFLGLGVPLFFCFGNLPSQNFWEFYLNNALIRAINIGIRFDLFGPGGR